MFRLKWPCSRITTRLTVLLLLPLVFTSNTTLAATLEVVVDGVTGPMRDNVLAALTIYQERSRTDLREARIRRLHATAPEQIRAALHPFGYYRPTIASTLDFDRFEDLWKARYRIELGPPVPVTAVEVTLSGDGAADPAFRALLDRFPIKRGDTLDQAKYDDAKRLFQALAAERGYFDFRLTRHEIHLDLEAYRAEIHLDIDVGARYRFGTVTADQDLLEPDLLQRYLRIAPGDYYSAKVLLNAQQSLSASNYFGEVTIDADPKLAVDRVIPVNVRVSPRPKNKYTLGAGYGTDTGPRGLARWERYYINPEGHHARIDLRGSKIDRALTAGYFIPIRNPQTDQLGFSGGFEETDTDTSTSSIRRLSVSRTTTRGYLLETLSVTQQRERFTVSDQSDTTSLLIPGVDWTYYLGDERIYTRRGARINLSIVGASDKIASDLTFGQTRLRLRGIYSVASFGRLIGRLDVGYTGIDDFNALPASLRFFAGGDSSVRGYAYNSLGPLDAQGKVVGGPNLLVGSIEYEQKLTENWSAAVFFDEGNAVNNFNDPLKRGSGVGLRWRTPIGQVRVDVAAALSEPDHPYRLHVTIGPDL